MKQKHNFILSIAFMTLLAVLLGGATQQLFADSKGSSKNGYLGVGIRDISSTLKNQLGIDGGVAVTWVDENSPADKAGLQDDDIIVKVNDKMIKKPSTLSRIIKKHEPGTKVKIEYYRNGKQKSVDVEIGSMKKHKSFSCHDGDKNFCISVFSGPYLGVHLFDLNKDLAPYFSVNENEGVLIGEVNEESPAAEAELKAGDVIIKMENENVSSVEEVINILSDYDADDEITIEVIRQKKKQSFKVVLAERDHDKHHMFLPDLPHKKLMFKYFDDHGDDFDADEDQVIKIKKKQKNMKGFI